jgi:hypothetical protein
LNKACDLAAMHIRRQGDIERSDAVIRRQFAA